MTTRTMPLWLVDKLDGDGVLDKATRLTHKPKPRRCPDCHAHTLAALNDYGIPTHLDPEPVSNAGELFALLTERVTYALDHGEIYSRDRWHIQGRPADTHTVYATHACGQPLPSRPPATGPPRVTADTHPDDPPF